MADPTDGDAPIARKLEGNRDPSLPEGADDSDRPLVGEATDPVVHKLLADRQNATLNKDTDMIRGIDKRLAELGYYRADTKEAASNG